MDYSYLNRFFLCFFIVITIFAYIFQLLIFLNFNIDNSQYNFDIIGLTRLSKNVHFSLCTIYDCNQNYIYSLIIDIIILSVMLFQEAIITNRDMVKIFIKRANTNITSCLKVAIDKFPKGNNKQRVFYIFTNGFDEEYGLYSQWKKHIFNDKNNSFSFIISKSNSLEEKQYKFLSQF